MTFPRAGERKKERRPQTVFTLKEWGQPGTGGTQHCKPAASKCIVLVLTVGSIGKRRMERNQPMASFPNPLPFPPLRIDYYNLRTAKERNKGFFPSTYCAALFIRIYYVCSIHMCKAVRGFMWCSRSICPFLLTSIQGKKKKTSCGFYATNMEVDRER